MVQVRVEANTNITKQIVSTLHKLANDNKRKWVDVVFTTELFSFRNQWHYIKINLGLYPPRDVKLRPIVCHRLYP
jgi:hypothetical protein